MQTWSYTTKQISFMFTDIAGTYCWHCKSLAYWMLVKRWKKLCINIFVTGEGHLNLYLQGLRVRACLGDALGDANVSTPLPCKLKWA